MATRKTVPAPAPAPAPAEEASYQYQVGDKVVFLGYFDDVPEEERYLTQGEVYEVGAITEEEPPSESNPEGTPAGVPVLLLPNPDFNPKKRESDENPKFYEVPVDESEIEPAPEEVAPPPAPAAKTAARKQAKATPPAAAAEPEGEAEGEASNEVILAEEEEDPQVLELVRSGESLVAIAQNLEAQVASQEYILGGIIYHLNKDKPYEQEAGAEQYGTGMDGFKNYLEAHLNIGYRKAMDLASIYVQFSRMGLENPAEHVSSIGWSKAAIVARAVVKAPEKSSEILEAAAQHSHADLPSVIKDTIVVGGTPASGGTRVARVKFNFKLVSEQATFAASVLAAVKSGNNLKDDNAAFLHIVTEYASQNGVGGTATAASAPRQQGPAVKTAAAKTAPATKTAPAAKTAAAPAAPAVKKAAPAAKKAVRA